MQLQIDKYVFFKT